MICFQYVTCTKKTLLWTGLIKCCYYLSRKKPGVKISLVLSCLKNIFNVGNNNIWIFLIEKWEYFERFLLRILKSTEVYNVYKSYLFTWRNSSFFLLTASLALSISCDGGNFVVITWKQRLLIILIDRNLIICFYSIKHVWWKVLCLIDWQAKPLDSWL